MRVLGILCLLSSALLADVAVLTEPLTPPRDPVRSALGAQPRVLPQLR